MYLFNVIAYCSYSVNYCLYNTLILEIIGCKIYLEGTITFENNAGAGTAVALQAESLGQILLTQSSRLMFTNNSARYTALLEVVQS